MPEYQRSYSWKEQQVQDFWLDMQGAIASSSQYFLGTLVLSKESEAGGTSVIDGQQRLATTTILLAALRNALLAAEEYELAGSYLTALAPLDPEDGLKKPRIRLNPSDHPYYEEVILEGKLKNPEQESHRRMKAAYDFFVEQIAVTQKKTPGGWTSSIAAVWKFLNKQANVVTVTAPTEGDAFVIFETLNDRGAGLTISDLLKNYLFSQSSYNLKSVQERWLAANVLLREYQEEEDFVLFLRHLWSSIHGSTRERDLYREIKAGIKGAPDALKFSEAIERGAKHYSALLSVDNEFWAAYSKSYKSALQNLIDLKLQQGRPTLLAVLAKFPKAEIEKTLTLFVSIYVRGIIAGGIGGGQAERYLSEAALEIRSGAIKDSAGLALKLRPIIASDSNFELAFKAFSTGDNRFARYLLLAVERKLETKSEPELVPNDDAEQVNLEHILPKKAKIADWPAFTADELLSFPHRIGNMTLLAKTPNGKIGNKGWPIKKPVLCASILKLNVPVCAQANWRTGEIEARQASLAKDAVLIWKI